MKKNLHIYSSGFINESRIFKTAKTLEDANVFDSIILLGIQTEKKLPLQQKYSDKVIIKRSRTFGFNSRIISLLIYYNYVFYTLVFRKPTILTIHSLELLCFAPIAKALGTKVIYDAHELETEKNGLKGFRKKASKKIEKSFIKNCDKVSVVGFEIAKFYKQLYPNIEPYIILNVPYFKKNETDIKKTLFHELFKLNIEDTIFLYQGLLGKGRGIEIMLDTFINYPDNTMKIVFMGYGELETKIKEASKKYPNILFKEAVPPEQVLDYTSSAHYGLALIENTSLSYYYCLPNKLFEYSQANIPMIVSDNLEMKNIVEKYEIGYVLQKNDSKHLGELLDKIDKKSFNKYLFKLNEFKKIYNWEAQEEIILEMYAI